MSPLARPSPRVLVGTALGVTLLVGGGLFATSTLKETAASSNTAQSSTASLQGKLNGMVGGTTSAAAAASPGIGGDQAAKAAAAGAKDSAAVASTRRVIRKADLQLESDWPETVQSQVTTLAASKGGFLVGGESHQTRSDDGAYTSDSTMEVRVPSVAFETTLSALRGLAKRVVNEKITGEDVTEEYVDLESRLRAQQALEAQYLTILKDAHSISDVLTVQEKVGQVQGEIEHTLGRRRFLENQSDLSTISVHVYKHVDAPPPPPPPVVETPGLGHSVQVAAHDSLALATDIVNSLIRALGVVLPFAVIFGLPMYLAFRVWRRRRNAFVASAPASVSVPVP